MSSSHDEGVGDRNRSRANTLLVTASIPARFRSRPQTSPGEILSLRFDQVR
eukprot:gene26203-biopygen14877